MHILAVLICLLSILSSCTSLSKLAPTSQKVDDEQGVIEPADDIIDSWIGGYSFFEFLPSDIGSAKMMSYSISIYEWEDKSYAYIAIDGWMTCSRLRAEIICDINKVDLVFDEYMQENMHGAYSKGDVLLSFQRKNTDIVTFWGDIQPMLYENRTSGNYFNMDSGVEFSIETHDKTAPVVEVG